MNSETAFRLILFPVDFSEASEAIAPHVRGMAELTGATVMLLHIVPWLSAWYGATELRPAVAGDPDFRNLEEQARVALEVFRKKHFAEIPSRADVRSGAVAETVTDTAAAERADLIMMPTRGLGRSRPFLIGSTTAKVLHDACCTVWTSPHLKDLKPFAPYKNIVCTVDREEIPQGYLEEATRLASCFGAKLAFVTAIPSCVGGCGGEHRTASLAREFPQAHAHRSVSLADFSVLTETGPVGDVVRKVAQDEHVDLVVTNRGHIQHPFGNFRSHTYEIVLESPCPVLSLYMFSPGETKGISGQR
jgi:nucleotide-binding universal stress UspA family protein